MNLLLQIYPTYFRVADMHPKIKHFLYEAEDHYLQTEEITSFKHHVSSLAERVETYEILRDNEIVIFQPIAEQLLATFPQHKQETLERALKNWLAVLRYSSMAMLLNNPEFLQYRLLEWLTEIAQVHQMQAIDTTLYQLLQTRLSELLSSEQIALLQPFLTQTEQSIFGAGNLAQMPG